MEDILYAFTSFGDYPFAAITLILMLVCYMAVFILQILRNKNVLLISLVMGLIVGIYYLFVSTYMQENLVMINGEEIDISQKVVDSIYMWLTMAWTVFMLLLLSVLPIYIFTMVSTTFTNARHNEGGRKLLIISFLSLWGMTLLGIVIALAFVPFMYMFKDGLELSGNLAGQEAVGIFGGIWPELEMAINKVLLRYGLIVLISIALAIIFAIIMNALHSKIHDKGESVIAFIERIKKGIRCYLKWITYMVPYVILGMLIVLFANYQNTFLNTVNSLIIFTTFFFIGLFIVWGIEYWIVNILRPNKNTLDKKSLNKITKVYAMNDFAVQSAPVLYPITLQYVSDLGVSERVKNTTPTLSTFMGYSMCGGFYPALIVIFTTLQPQPFMTEGVQLTFWLWLLIISLMVPLIMIMTLGMTGVPGADVAIILGLLAALGLNPNYFFTIYLIEPMLDKFRGVGNSMGFAAATVITERITKESEDIEEIRDKVFYEEKEE